MQIRLKGLFSVILFTICLLVAFWVGMSNVPNEGLSLLFLLPLAFAFTTVLFSKEYGYSKNSFGLALLYFSSAVRYVVTPVLIVAGQSTVSTILANNEDYRYAIFVELFELIVVMLAVKFIWPKHLEKKEQIKKEHSYDLNGTTFRLSWTGFAFVALMVVLVLFRGHLDNIISHLSTWFNRVDNKEDVFGYDMMAFNIVKTVAFLVIVSMMKRVYDKTNLKTMPVVISLAAGLMNTMFFEYRERTDLAVLVIASFFVLSYAFPKHKKALGVIFGIGGVVLVAMVFMEGSLSYEVGSSISTVNVADYSKVAELYTTGPSVIANARMNYAAMKSQMSLHTIAKDLIGCCDLFSTIPFLRFIPNAVADVNSSVEIYVASIDGLAYILPNHSLAALYVGNVLSWFLEPLIIIFNVLLLGWFERIMYKINDLVQVYSIYSIVTMVSVGIFCNNVELMLHSFSSLPLWLLIFSYVNSFGNNFNARKTDYKLKRAYDA